jgi:hypothetical protein
MKGFKYNLNNYYPTKNILAGTGIILLILFSSCNQGKNYIINKSIELQIKKFIKQARYYTNSQSSADTVILDFTKRGTYYAISFEYTRPTVYNDMYGVIEDSNRVIFFYSDNDISNLIYVKQPHKVDTMHYKIWHHVPMIIDWYSELLYFKNNTFSRDTLLSP